MKNLIFFLPMLLLVACQSGTTTEQKSDPMPEKAEMKMANPAIMSFFEEVNVVKMHLFATSEAMPNAEEYPYSGKAITGDALSFLGNDLTPTENGSAYGCYHTENSNHFIVRLQNGEMGNSLVLAKWNPATEKLMKIMDLASLNCKEGICKQQDAWLADLDDSRTLELILRQHTRNEKGNVSDESFVVLTDDGNGQFIKTNEQLASLAVKDNYVMQ